MDIRAGNWFVDILDNNYCVIRELTPVIRVERFHGRLYTVNISQLIPIQITEDRLLAAGFKAIDNYYELKLNGYHFVLIKCITNSYRWYKAGVADREMRFIHELQNGFLDETGIPLVINLFGIK